MRSFLYPPFPLSKRPLQQKDPKGSDFYKVWLEDGQWFGAELWEVGSGGGEVRAVLVYRDSSREVGYPIRLPVSSSRGAAERAVPRKAGIRRGRKMRPFLFGAGGTPYLVLRNFNEKENDWTVAVGREGAVYTAPPCTMDAPSIDGARRSALMAVGRRGVLAALLDGKKAAGLGSYEDYLWLVDAVRDMIGKYLEDLRSGKVSGRPYCQTVLCAASESEAVCTWLTREYGSSPTTRIYACDAGGCRAIDSTAAVPSVAVFGGRPAAVYAEHLNIPPFNLMLADLYTPDGKGRLYYGYVAEDGLRRSCSLYYSKQIFLAAGGACMKTVCGRSEEERVLCASPASRSVAAYDEKRPLLPFDSVADDLGLKTISIPS